MTERTQLARPIELANALGKGLSALGAPLGRFSPRALKRRATRIARLSDFGPPSYGEGLDVLCRSAEEAGLSLLGSATVAEIITGALVSRLRRIDTIKRRPGLQRTPLIPPILIVGARSGTTFLHRLLCGDRRARALALWEVTRPVAPLGRRDRRRREALRQVAWLKRFFPGIDAKHLIDADEPEEDIFLLNSTLRGAGFYQLAPLYSYVDWLSGQDLTSAYGEYLEHLKIFQAQTPRRRLTLKAPAHLFSMKELLSVIPRALVVQTHREPAEVLASMNSLIHTMHSGLCDDFDGRRMATFNMNYFDKILRRGEEALSVHPKDQVLHIRYDDLVRDPLAAVLGLYERFGLCAGGELVERLTAQIEARPKDKHGRHSYSLEQFGLSGEEVDRRFSWYRSKYLGGER